MIDTAWSRGILLQSRPENDLFFEEKTVKNYHKINEFHDDAGMRPMHSLRRPTWRF